MVRRPPAGAANGAAADPATAGAREGAPDTVHTSRELAGRNPRQVETDALSLEMDHRVKNLLAAVQSLAAQSTRYATSMDGFLDSFLGRIDALATADTLLSATRWRSAAVGAVATAVLGGLSQGRVTWRGPHVPLNARATTALTLALHELGANAIKFGALAHESGQVDVTWRALDLGGFELEWVEVGGAPTDKNAGYGFGRTLIERVTGRELGGTGVFELAPEGLRVRLKASAAALSDAPSALRSRADPASNPVGASSGAEGLDNLNGVKVLIVEDALLLALELESGLTEAGAHVVGVASDLDEARRLFRQDFDVAVLDANLNGQSVAPIAHGLSQRGTPFIFATGYRDLGEETAGFDAPVVLKPYNVRQIAAALRLALGA